MDSYVYTYTVYEYTVSSVSDEKIVIDSKITRTQGISIFCLMSVTHP